MIEKKILEEQLINNIKSIDKSLTMFNYSLNKAKKIGLKKEYTMKELEILESLSGRFSRTTDILTQKILKTLFMLMQEDTKTFIDRCNLCEKLEIISDAEVLYNIRNLRNEIVHEYVADDITEIFKPLLTYSDNLLEIIDSIKNYININLKSEK
ncbi:MAG: hypothetical protein U9R41_01095 [Candidatus Marinimicrobia bacterium]|nr:hypothetical protein [Candidatus Neomarinimicrobiota bacterium]